MKILLMSDTHGTCDERMMKHVYWADEIWHAGDWGPDISEKLLATGKPLRGVFGNIDDAGMRILYPETLMWQVNGLRVLMTHIGGKPGKLPAKIVKAITQSDSSVFICGHSHLLNVGHDPATRALCLNPGAAGIHGFHKVRTMLRFELLNGKISNLAAVEMGNRSQIESAKNIA